MSGRRRRNGRQRPTSSSGCRRVASGPDQSRWKYARQPPASPASSSVRKRTWWPLADAHRHRARRRVRAQRVLRGVAGAIPSCARTSTMQAATHVRRGRRRFSRRAATTQDGRLVLAQPQLGHLTRELEAQVRTGQLVVVEDDVCERRRQARQVDTAAFLGATGAARTGTKRPKYAPATQKFHVACPFPPTPVTRGGFEISTGTETSASGTEHSERSIRHSACRTRRSRRNRGDAVRRVSRFDKLPR
jgi:hypothetical protein